MIKAFFKRPQVWGFFVSVAVMAIISLAFFYPDNFEGNSLRQPDMQQGAANGHEAAVYEAETGEKALWTNSLFGGMPTFQISPSYPSNSLFTWINTVYGLWLPAPSNLLFMMMMGFLLLLFALKMRWYYALIGAVAWGFSSYFVIIIGAGHIWKFLALSYVPPTIAGFILLYRGRRLTGAAMLGLFAMLQLNANHPQMTYYFGLTMAIMAVAYLVEAVRMKRMRRWLAATGIAIGVGALALGANAPSLYNTYEYSKETKRATSELTPLGGATATPSERPTGGLPKSDIVGWSYGRAEMFSLIVPNVRGGASARPEQGSMQHMSLAQLDEAAKYADNAPTSMLLQYLTQYFNNSEGTNGPVYVGVLIAVFFILGCFIVRGPLKWALVAATVMSILLSLGANLEWLTDLMIYHFPMYSKFRAVESILVVAEFCMPLLAVLALAQLVRDGAGAWKKYKTALCVSFGFPALVALVAVVMPSAFGAAINDADRMYSEQLQKQIADYYRQSGATDSQTAQAVYDFSLANPANIEAVSELRFGLVRSDGWRSLLFLVLGAGFLALFYSGKARRGVAVAGIGTLVLVDLYSADKRYVSHSSFGPADEGGEIVFTPDAVDKAIMADTAGEYRVFDIPGFYGADRSYFHHTLGGYHAAKLRRYEDLIQRKLSPVLRYGYMPDDPVLDDPRVAEIAGDLRTGYRVADMLNARYVITGDENTPVVKNPNALGNAWLVDGIVWVDGADAEMAALDASTLDFAHQAVADRRFAGVLPEEPSLAPGDTIYMTSYSPNELKYHVSTARGGIGVFSEIYFPWGWKATVDGQPAELARVNYVLRAMALPAGSHEVTMRFEPDSIRTTSTVAYACVTMIYLLLAAAAFREGRRCKLY